MINNVIKYENVHDYSQGTLSVTMMIIIVVDE